MSKRINVILPETTIHLLDRLAKPGERSRVIDKAVQHYADTRSAEALQEQLKQATIRDRDLDLETTAEWAAVDHESWQRHTEVSSADPGRSAARSTSRRSTRR